MPTQATAVSQQSAIETAKAPIAAYNDKDWDRARGGMTPDFVYDEVATRRRAQGSDEALALWQGWARAFPDSKATFHNAHVSGNNVVLEVTWTGTHTGPLDTPKGSLPATGRRIEVRACIIQEVAGDRVRAQRHYFDMATLFEQLGVA